MEPRYGLVLGAVVAMAAAALFVVAPVSWFGDLLDVTGEDATRFLVRRYAASATAAVGVITIAVLRQASARTAALLGLATWFGGQGAVAIWGLAAGTVGGVAWLAVFADPLLSAWFLALASRAAGRTPGRARPVPMRQ